VAWHPTSVLQDGSGAAEPSSHDPAEDPNKGNSAHMPVSGIAGSAPGEPDPRLLYANERTFLAWIRTSLALVAAGLAIIELLPAFKLVGGRRAVGLPLIALGTWLAAMAFRTWTQNERAMRAGEPLPHNHQVLVLAIGVAVVAFVALILSAFS
jgi:putative membrane protein